MQRIEKWLFPPRCVVSGAPAPEQDILPEIALKSTRPGTFCPVCAEKLPNLVADNTACGACLAAPPAFVRTQVGFDFDETFQQLIHGFKYHDQLSHSRLLAALMLDNLVLEGVEALLPVPLHKSRLLTRGFNQSLELAKQLSSLTGLPVLANAVERVKATPPQANLSKPERLANVKGAFAVNPQGKAELAAFKQIAMVDDVMTTGATFNQLAKVVRKANPALSVQAWAVAKA